MVDGHPELMEPEEWDYEAQQDEVYDEEVAKRKAAEIIGVSPSEFVEFAVKMPDKEAQQHVNFSFENRRYLRMPYDTNSIRTLYKCGRQVEKSTLLGNKSLAYACINNAFNILYVSPTNQQTKTFSQDRLREPIETSDVLQGVDDDPALGQRLPQEVHQPQPDHAPIRVPQRRPYSWHPGGHDPDRRAPGHHHRQHPGHRGVRLPLPVQDLHLLGDTEVHRQHHREVLERLLDAERVGRSVPAHGTPKDASSWHWNILGEANIGKKGLICDKCGELIQRCTQSPSGCP
jgi:hypothetical protein